MVVEIVAGVISKSLAILTDAAHMLSDLSSFGVSLAALHFATLPGTKQLSFGYHRIEILGALFSILVIWAMTGCLVAAAVARILNPEEVQAPIMIYTVSYRTRDGLLKLGYFWSRYQYRTRLYSGIAPPSPWAPLSRRKGCSSDNIGRSWNGC